jgi:site-specific recombinase XerD
MGTDHIAAYVHARRLNGDYAPSTVRLVRTMLRAWHTHAGDDLTAWTPGLAAAWVNDDQRRPATRKSRLGKLRPYVRWLITEQLLETDITARIAAVRVPAGAPRDFTTQEVEQIIRAAGTERERLIVLAMAHLGLRCGDLARVRIEDIDARHRSLKVRGKGGRGEVTHELPIPAALWSVLVRWLRSEQRSAGALVASLHTGQALRPDSVGDIVGRIIGDAGLRIHPGDGRTPHALRHTFATALVDGGADLRLVQHALGHRSIRSSELYVRREPPGLRDAMEQQRFAA